MNSNNPRGRGGGRMGGAPRHTNNYRSGNGTGSRGGGVNRGYRSSTPRENTSYGSEAGTSTGSGGASRGGSGYSNYRTSPPRQNNTSYGSGTGIGGGSRGDRYNRYRSPPRYNTSSYGNGAGSGYTNYRNSPPSQNSSHGTGSETESGGGSRCGYGNYKNNSSSQNTSSYGNGTGNGTGSRDGTGYNSYRTSVPSQNTSSYANGTGAEAGSRADGGYDSYRSNPSQNTSSYGSGGGSRSGYDSYRSSPPSQNIPSCGNGIVTGSGGGNYGDGGYGSLPRSDRYGSSTSQYTETTYNDRESNYRDYREEQRNRDNYVYNRPHPEAQDYSDGYQERQSCRQESYESTGTLVNGQRSTSQLHVSPVSPSYGTEQTDSYVDPVNSYTNNGRYFQWNESGETVANSAPPRSAAPTIPYDDHQSYAPHVCPDSMSRSGEDSRSSQPSSAGYYSSNDSSLGYAQSYSPDYSPDFAPYYHNPALDFENDPYAPPGGYTHRSEGVFSRKRYPGSRSEVHATWGFNPNESHNYSSNSYNNRLKENRNEGRATVTQNAVNQAPVAEIAPPERPKEEAFLENPRRDDRREQRAVVPSGGEQRRNEAPRRSPGELSRESRGGEERREMMGGVQKKRVYDDWGEVKGTLVFERGGGGVNLYQGPDDLDEEGNYIPGLVQNPFKAPRGWIPTESTIENLFKNDQENVAKNQVVQERACIVVGETTAKRFDSWDDSGLHDHLVRVLVEKCGFQKPRPIQISAASEIMAGKNIVAQSVTGSGKTLAFVLPIVDKILKKGTSFQRGNSCRKPLAVVVQPTRELALQVYDAFRRVTDGTDIRCVCVFGQMDKWRICSALYKGVDIYVGTVGRLMDLANHREVYFERLEFFVIDEADRFLNSKEMEQLRAVVKTEDFKKTDEKRQTLVFSATMTEECVQIAQTIMKKDYVTIKNNDTKANRLVKQVYLEAKGKQAKNTLLKNIFDQDKKENVVVKTLIFVDTKKQSDFLALELINMHYSAHSINGDRPQNIRDEIYHKFLDGQISILVGTDVCSRGWDIPNLQRVINYDLPQINENESMETVVDKYVHRIGRTGRIREGTAVTFVDPRMDKEISADLVEICREVGQEPPNFLLELAGEPCHVDAFAPPVGFIEGEVPKWSDLVAKSEGCGEEKSEMEAAETPILGEDSSDEHEEEVLGEEEEVLDVEEEERGGNRRRLNTVQEESESEDEAYEESDDEDDDVMEEPIEPAKDDVTVSSSGVTVTGNDVVEPVAED